MRIPTAAVISLALSLGMAGCANQGPDYKPAPKRELTRAEHLDECMNRFNACQTDMWCAEQPVCQQQNQQQQQPGLPPVQQPRLPRVP